MAYTVRQRKTLDPTGQALAEKDDDQEAEVLDTQGMWHASWRRGTQLALTWTVARTRSEQEQLIEEYERSHRKYTKFYRVRLSGGDAHVA